MFMHVPGKKFSDFNAIRAEIEAETDRGAGKGKSVSSKPINLRIFSPRVLNLTLVDLPGLTKVAIGDQPKDIEVQIRKMVRQFIENPNSIILAVSAANVDLANSDALNLAREVDPDGIRTIGVLTKLDLMDKGTNAMDVLQGRVYPLRLGFIGVINRSQHDINTNKPVNEALKQEKEFFEQHPLYSSIKSRSGYPYLAATLNRVLLNTIRDTLPDLKKDLTNRLRIAQDALEELGDSQMNQSKSALMLNILTRYCSIFTATIDGQLPDLPLDSLYGGSRINYIFVDVFGKCLEAMSATDGLSQDDIRMAITNASGARIALFMPEAAFDQVVRQQVRKLESPSLECADCVFEELKSIAHKIDLPELRRFGALRERISEVVQALLAECHKPAKKMISSLISIERDYINISHPEFIGGDKAIGKATQERAAIEAERTPVAAIPSTSSSSSSSSSSSAQGRSATKPSIPNDIPKEVHHQFEKSRDEMLSERSRKEEAVRREEEAAAAKAASEAGFFSRLFKGVPSSSKDKSTDRHRITQPPVNITSASLGSSAPSDFQTHVLTILLTSYFDIVKKSVRDRVPKAIMHFLVTKAKTSLQTELVRQLYKEDVLDDLLRESGDVASRRLKYSQSIDLLKKVLSLLGDVETSRM
jgi:dynamin 1-like protein